ncbi:MAG: MarR family winged helix-turn-helix transcriptional regulator [Candidatus Falkowbacteria bacterium]
MNLPSPSPTLHFILQLAKMQTVLNRRLDSKLGGIGFSEFIILYTLSQAEGQKMRRIDLAEKVGLTASGVTRLLLPMEKIGLIKKETNEHDARSSFVLIAPGGKEKLTEGFERAEIFCEEILAPAKAKKIDSLSELIKDFTI